MNRKSLLRNFTSAVLGAAIMFSTVSVANAVTLTYNFHLTTPNGTPVTDLVLYAAGGGQDAVILSPTEIPASGISSLTYSVGFVPTEALVVGISKRTTEEKWDILMFTDNDFASDALGQRFDVAFPNFGYSYPLGHLHSVLPGLLQDAHDGDIGSLNSITEILRHPDASLAYFDPYGPFSIAHWTIETIPGGSIPEPGTLALFGIGLAGLGYARRRKTA